MTNYYSSSMQSWVERAVRDFARPCQVFLSTSAGHRPITYLPQLIVGLDLLLLDLQEQELSLDPVLYTQLRVFLHSLQEELEQCQRLGMVVQEPPAPPGREWITGEDGIRRLDINEDDLRALCEEGAIDEDIGDLLGCCMKTVQQRREALNLKKRVFANLSRDDLTLVRAVL